MPRGYNAPVQDAALSTTGVNTPWHLQGAATIRPALSRFIFGPRTSADTVVAFSIARSTNANSVATGTALVEAALDDTLSQAATAICTSGAKGTVYTTGPTFGVIMHPVGLHQRATYEWIAQPGREIQAAAAATAGIALKIEAVTAFNADFMGSWDE